MMINQVCKGAVVGLLLLLASTAHAAIWQESMQVELTLGERDTRVSVRAAALEDIRTRASQKVGMIVESTMVSNGTKLTEEIRTVGVSLMKIENVKDELRLQKDGSARLAVSALVTVDTAELDRRAAAMRQDSDKAEKIRLLAVENQTLRKTLDEINRQLAQQGSAANAADLLKRQATIFENLSNNARRVGQTFEQGALLNLAQQDAQNWNSVKAEIDAEVIERLLNTKVSANVVRVENNSTGVSVLVQVGWEADQAGVFDNLKRHVLVSKGSGNSFTGGQYLSVPERDNGVKLDRPYAERVFRHLISSNISLELSVGGAKTYIPLMFASNEFMAECQSVMSSWPNDGFPRNVNVCISFQSKETQHLRAMAGNGTNPIKLALSKAQARSATEVSAVWVLRRADGAEVRRQALSL